MKELVRPNESIWIEECGMGTGKLWHFFAGGLEKRMESASSV
jgi:hypothetical protein